ncbi:AzlD domain-containing protein [Pelomicrobium sp. G1]|uniref:AzlD domain-containing protein n=1 Tax=unclassified Pelomicrobium TaxID=2815318 RepID=UPI0021DD452C|nr:MAG: hypothetical protein KatS3mg123_0056 [Burkholderiales bacterium]
MAADLARSPYWPWILLAAATVGTYLWRGLGVAFAGRLRLDSPLFQWFTCVTYAMLAALVARVIVLPVGILAETPLAFRLVAAAAGMAVMLWRRGGLLPGLAAGTGLLILLSAMVADHHRATLW